MRGPLAQSLPEPPTHYAPPPLPRRTVRGRTALFAGIAGIHLGLLALAFSVVTRPETPPAPTALSVRMLAAEMPAPAEAPRPLPAPPPSQRRLAPNRERPSPPVLTAAAPTAAVSFTVAPPPENRTPETPAPPAAVVAPLVAARFDADYLQNPKPAYPMVSRRLGEEGRVVLQVRVSIQGLPLEIDIKQSSGFARLDEAARSAVGKWRFVPARRGDEALESSVLVPLTFKLET